MTGYYYLLIAGLIVTLVIFLYLIGRIVEQASAIKGKKPGGVPAGNSFLAFCFMIIGMLFLLGTAWSFLEFKDTFLPESASVEGVIIDEQTELTFIVTGIVFVLTHIALFWFAFKYRFSKTRKAEFYPHNNTLEWIWTIVPSIVLAWLIGQGISAWNLIMAPPIEAESQTIEVTAKQFGWIIRYPGPDGKLGKRAFKYMDDNKNNELGIDLSDPDAQDDFYASELVLPLGKDVLVKLGARDVLHSFFLPHFRVKMDCVPGMPTHFNFIPRLTTQQMRDKLGNQEFNYELACAEMCGTGHYGMMKEVIVLEQQDFDAWAQKQYEDNKTYKALIEQ